MKHIIVLFAVLLPAIAAAHGDEEGGSVWIREAALLIPLFAVGFVYLTGLLRVRARSQSPRIVSRQTMLFWFGWLTIAVSLLSPLHELGERSFAAHMVEHELLMLVAAPCMALSRPVAIYLWSLPPRARQWMVAHTRDNAFAYCWRALSHPAVATALQVIALWAWHAPVLFDKALHSEVWHAAQHLSFFLTALLFWWSLTHGGQSRERRMSAALYLFITSVMTGALGALMAISSSPWYAGYAEMGLHGQLFAGLSAAEDQQLAGLIMWIPGGLVHFIAALFFFRKALSGYSISQPGAHASHASGPG